MNLKQIIDKKDQAAQYMVDEITYICEKFEKRAPGSKGEHQACEYAAKQMKEYGCDRVYVDEFKENPDSFYGWIYFTITCCFLALASYFFIPALSIVFIALGLVLCVLQFGLYKKTVDKVFKEETGHNAAGFKKPTGEVKRRIIFNGHPDATWEWPFKYMFTYLGFDIHMMICFVGAFYTLGIAIAKLAGAFDSNPDLAKTLGLVALVFAPFWFGLYFMWNKKRVVDGANDNLTGCYMGLAILKFLKDEGIELENTEIGVVLTGSEEAGLRGAKAWCEAHAKEFDDVPTFVYSYDTITQSEQLMVNYRDLNSTVKVDKDVSDLFYEACQDLGIPVKKGFVPPLGGATDSAAFAQAGMRATGITALNHALPDFYHTRLDTPEALNKDCLAKCFAASVKVLEKFDDGAKQ
ncbi:MAG: M20/M25/M40 family metallo-hydrolase [Clostridia bacterium]|nr:M20/M25/M40 family metallo-hydrolase [Clostridia bacterium]